MSGKQMWEERKRCSQRHATKTTETGVVNLPSQACNECVKFSSLSLPFSRLSKREKTGVSSKKLLPTLIPIFFFYFGDTFSYTRHRPLYTENKSCPDFSLFLSVLLSLSFHLHFFSSEFYSSLVSDSSLFVSEDDESSAYLSFLVRNRSGVSSEALCQVHSGFKH